MKQKMTVLWYFILCSLIIPYTGISTLYVDTYLHHMIIHYLLTSRNNIFISVCTLEGNQKDIR